MLDVTIKKAAEETNFEKGKLGEAMRVEPITVELVARPVFDPKLNFWYAGTPPALEEPLVEINPQAQQSAWQASTPDASEDLVFDPKLNFWFTKKPEQQDEEGKAAATREKMEREGRAIMEEEKANAKKEEEKRAKAAASVYDQMRLKAIEDSKAEAAAKIKAAKETKVMEELMKKKEELETKIGKNQTKPKAVAGPEAVTVEACVMGQRELAKKKKEDMEKKSEEEERDKKATCEAPGKKAFSLPMDDDSDDWMLDDDVGTMIEDEEDESEKTKVSPEIVEKVVEGDAKKVAFSLPMDDNSDDWMLDDDVGAMIDDEDEEDGSSSNTAREEISGKEEKSGKDEKNGNEEEKRIPDLAEKKSFALPLDDASDDWMLDDDLGTMIEDEEEEAENEQKKKEPSSSKVETEKVTEKKSFSLPLDDASDDWMLDDDLGAMVEDEQEDPQVVLEVPSSSSSCSGSEVGKKSFSLPLDDASDDWMLEEDVGAMVEEEKETPESTKEETGKEESKKPADHLVSDKKLPVDKPTMEEKEEKEPIDKKQATEKGDGQSQKKSKKTKNKKK